MSYYQTNARRRSLLGHISLGVKSMAACEPFYSAVLAPFGIIQVFRNASKGSAATACGWGYDSFEPFTLFESTGVCLYIFSNLDSRGLKISLC
jgi:hypothetical protein